MPDSDDHIFQDWLEHTTKARKLENEHMETIAEQLTKRHPDMVKQVLREEGYDIE